MKSFFSYLLLCIVLSIAVLVVFKLCPQNDKVKNVRHYLNKLVEESSPWVLVPIALALPVISVIYLLVWTFKDDFSGNVQNQRRGDAVMLFIRNAVFMVLTEQPEGIYPVIRPKTLASLPIQSVIYKNASAYQLCVNKKNIPVTPDDTEVFKLHLNAEIERHFIENNFPVQQDPNLIGVDLHFKVADVFAHEAYWDIFLVPVTFVDQPKAVLSKADMRDDEF